MVGPQGQLVLLDRYNHLWEATQDPGTKAWVLSPDPKTRLGPGRPLGYHFDRHGNLIVCDSLKVGSAGEHIHCIAISPSCSRMHCLGRYSFGVVWDAAVLARS